MHIRLYCGPSIVDQETARLAADPQFRDVRAGTEAVYLRVDAVDRLDAHLKLERALGYQLGAGDVTTLP